MIPSLLEVPQISQCLNSQGGNLSDSFDKSTEKPKSPAPGRSGRERREVF